MSTNIPRGALTFFFYFLSIKSRGRDYVLNSFISHETMVPSYGLIGHSFSFNIMIDEEHEKNELEDSGLRNEYDL
jgi:hypothetical protein